MAVCVRGCTCMRFVCECSQQEDGERLHMAVLVRGHCTYKILCITRVEFLPVCLWQRGTSPSRWPEASEECRIRQS